MTYTNNSDFYFAIHENGINRVINRAMRYVPSFFNYGSSYISMHPQLACNTIDADPSVTACGDPLISAINLPLPPNIPLTLNPLPLTIYLPLPDFIVQLSEMQVDFHPGDVIALPGTLPPLPNQQLALHAKTFMGLSCPSREKRGLECFSLDLFAELALKNPYTTQFLNMDITALDVEGIKPDGLKNILDCYMMYLANQALSFVSSLTNHLVSTPQTVPNLYGVATVQVSPAAVPNNPAVEDDQLKLFMNLASFKLNEVVGPSGSSLPGSNLAPATSHSTRTRPGTGPSDLTIAISEAAFSKIFGAMLNGGITLDIPAPPWPTPPPPIGWGQSGSSNSLFYLYYKVSASLQNGTISLQDDGKIQIKDLVISWDTLKFKININIPTISIPGIGDLFGNNPDISIPIDLSGDFQSQVSIVAEPAIFYGDGNPGIPNCPNRWQLYIIPQLPIFVLPVELNAKLIKSINDGIKSFFTSLGFPDWAMTLIMDALTAIDTIFGDFNKIAESIVDMIETDIGITQLLDNLLYDYLTNQAPIFELPDPYNVSVADHNTHRPANNIPIPIAYLGVSVNSSEMVLEGDIGP
jgi:hypothetical protein